MVTVDSMTQFDLDFGANDRIQANFERFHAANPRVFHLWGRFTLQMIRAGFKRGSASLVAERIRWETGVATTSDPPIKLNNNYRSRYARLWMRENPTRAGFFRTRELADSSSDSVIGAALHYGVRR